MFQGSSASEDEARPGTAAAAAAQKREERLRKFRELHMKRVRGGGRSGTGSCSTVPLIRGENEAEGSVGVARSSSGAGRPRSGGPGGVVPPVRCWHRIGDCPAYPTPVRAGDGFFSPLPKSSVLRGTISDRRPGPAPGWAPAILGGSVCLVAAIERYRA